jgi:hypothetical protein
MKRLLAAAATLGTVASIGAAQVSSAADAPRGGVLHLTKECSAWAGQADQHCTITSSNVRAIPVGARVVYLQAAGARSLSSDLVVVVGPGDYALGHVSLDLTTGTGTVVLSGGRGHLKGFHARLAVSPLGGVNFGWDGRYRVGP